MINATEHPVGARMLLKGGDIFDSPREVTVVEWTPDNKAVKLKCANAVGDTYYQWYIGDDLAEVKVVANLRPEPQQLNPFSMLEDMMTNINQLYKKYNA